MSLFDEIKTAYDEYASNCITLQKNARAIDGFFGMGDDPKKDHSHMEFYNKIGTLCESFLSDAHDYSQLQALSSLILFSAHDHEANELAYWMMYAAQAHAKAMIPLLEPADAADFLAKYDEYYPKKLRMPLQKEIYEMLKARASASGNPPRQTKRKFSFLKG